jgi:IS30 family transposase
VSVWGTTTNCEGERNFGSNGRNRVSRKYWEVSERQKKVILSHDQLTKMAHFIPTMTDISAPDLMKLHIHHIWKLHRIPLIHGTDHGLTFMANFMKSIYKDLGIEPCFSTAYHPQTQGQVENNNKWMEMYLRMFCSH